MLFMVCNVIYESVGKVIEILILHLVAKKFSPICCNLQSLLSFISIDASLLSSSFSVTRK